MNRSPAATCIGLAAAVVLGGCGGSTSPDTTTPPPTPAPTASPAPTSPADTLGADAPDAADQPVTEAEVAQIEQQLDDIDQLLSDLDADLAAD